MARSRPSTSSSDTTNDNHSSDSSTAGRAARFRAEIDSNVKAKIVVSMQPYNMGDPNMTIQFAQEEFFSMFGYTESSMPMKLDALYGPGTKRHTAFQLQNAVISRRADLEYINLYRADGSVLACHVSLISMVGDGPPPKPLVDVPADPNQCKDERWAVLTIRNASAVGNSKFCGIGLLGTERVLMERLDEIGGTA